jgi:predicted dehydrogenase
MVGFCQGCKPLPEWEAEHEGPMLHDAVHLYDLMRFFAGDVAWVQGSAERRRRMDLRVEDTSLATLQFASGVQGVAVVDELTEFSRFELELHFERGLVRVAGDFSAQKSVPLAGTTETWWSELALDELPAAAWPEPGLLRAAQDLVQCIETDHSPRCTGEDGRAAIEVIMALYESERRGRARVEMPFGDGRRMLDVLREEGVY